MPATRRSLSRVEELYSIHEQIPYPFFVKGALLRRHRWRAAWTRRSGPSTSVVAKWGLPVIVQAQVEGDELNVVAVGDGEGGLVGALPMKKTSITDKGKGWAGIAIKDPQLIELTRSFTAASSWRGPARWR